MKLYALKKSEKYPDGIEYRLIVFDLWTGRRVLMDNHHPKGPHYHVDVKEYAHTFADEETLFADFKRLTLEHLGVQI